MRSRDFVFWLQGFFEISEPATLSMSQVELVKKHLALVFKHKIDAEMGGEAHQDKLNAIHNGGAPTTSVDAVLANDRPTETHTRIVANNVEMMVCLVTND